MNTSFKNTTLTSMLWWWMLGPRLEVTLDSNNTLPCFVRLSSINGLLFLFLVFIVTVFLPFTILLVITRLSVTATTLI
jgi:hypothetical protein